MCHTLLVSALPHTPPPPPAWTSPVTATVRLVTGGDRKRWSWVGALLLNLGGLIREAALIVGAVAAAVYGAFQLAEVAGWFALCVGLLLLDWSRREKRPAGDGSPP